MIKITKVEGAKHQNVVFRDSALAHKYCDEGEGIEFGAAAHNPFNLKGALNMAPNGRKGSKDNKDFLFFKEAQTKMCGAYAEIDIAGEMSKTGLADNFVDWVISSHVFEHEVDPISALVELYRIVKPNGYAFFIIPLPEAIDKDGRGVTPYEKLERCYGASVDDVPDFLADIPRRGHYHIYTLASFIDLVERTNNEMGLTWAVVDTEEVDTKVGNGFTCVLQKIVEVPEVDFEEDEAWEPDGITVDLDQQLQDMLDEAVAEAKEIDILS